MYARSKIAIEVLSVLAFAGALAAAAHYRNGIKPAAPLVPLIIATNATYIGTSLVFIAAANDFFKAEGLEVTLQPHASGQAALNAAPAGQADLATVAEVPVIFAAASGRPVMIIASIASQIRDQGIVARRDRGIAHASDFKGKRIGVTLGTSALHSA